MKTFRHILLLTMLLVGYSAANAQCVWGTNAYVNAGSVQFSAYVDSNSLAGVDYFWDFGDGDTAQDLYPLHTYGANGTYVACFNYSSNNCPLVTLCDSVYIDLCAFNPNINYTTSGLDVTFSVNNAPVGSTYNWTFYTGGTPVTSTSANPTITFPSYSMFSAHVDVSAPGGCIDTAITYVDVVNPCNANFGYGVTALYEVSFYAYQLDSLNPSGTTYNWDFGDGATNTIAHPVHLYDSNGVYHVCLTVTGTACSANLCLDINVTTPPPPMYYLSGYINSGSSTACSAKVFLISDSSGFLSLVNMTHTIDSFGNNCNGAYTFDMVPQGTYYVKAALDSDDIHYAGYLPTYYGDELNWADALAVNLTTSGLGNININLVAGVNPGGPGFVGGWVSQGAGLAIGGGVDESRAAGDPLPGVQVNLLTLNDVAVASTYTDANGRYSFSNLQVGTYKVYVEEINKVPYPMSVTLDANNPSQDNVNVTVNSNSAVTGIEDLNSIRVTGIYPNPVNDKTSVTVTMQQNSKVRMTLTDANGRLIQSRNLELVSGTNSIKLDMNEEATGVYHLSLTNDNNKKIIRLVKVN